MGGVLPLPDPIATVDVPKQQDDTEAPRRGSARDRHYRSAFALWIAALVAGFSGLHAYENRPGEPGDTAETWPSHSTLERSADRPTIVVFAHPHCPCTSATMEELDRLISRAGADTSLVHVLFYCPDDAAPSFAETSLREHAERIPGVHTQLDRGGRVAAEFGARTSGQTLIYDPTGALRFHGGITSSRGHIGANRATRAAEDILGNSRAPTRAPLPLAVFRSPVFGCPLFEEFADPGGDE